MRIVFARLRKTELPVPGTLANVAGAAVRWPVLCIAGFIFVFVALNSFLYTSYFADTSLEIVHQKRDTLWLNLLVLAAFVAFLWLLGKSGLKRLLTARRLQWLLFLYALAGGTLWVIASGSAAYAEPATISGYAMEFAKGDFSAMGAQGYYAMFPYQLGFTAYVQLVYALFGPGNDTALQLLNVAFTGGSFVLVSSLCHRMFKDEAVTSLCCLLLYGCVYLLLLCTFTYGTLPGLFFALLGLWLALRAFGGAGTRWLALAALPLALAVVLKSNYLIFMLAVLIAGVVHFLREKRAATLGAVALVALLSLGAMPVVYFGYGLASGETVGKGVPNTAWVAMGLDMDNYYMAPGWYNGYTYSSYPDNGYDHQAAQHEADAMVQAELAQMRQQPGRAARFFYEKALSQWNEPTHQSVMLGYHAARAGWQRPKLVNDVYDGSLTFAGWLAEVVMDKVHLLVYLGAALGLVLGRRRLGWMALLPAMVVVGGFLFHLVWEAKSQYIAPYFILCVPYAALGWAGVYRGLRKLPRRLKANKVKDSTP